MERKYFNVENDGFYGAYYPCPKISNSVFIYMLGPSVDNFLVTAGVKWLHTLGCNVMAVSPEPERKGFYNIPLERYGAVIKWLKQHDNIRIGITGGSATGMMALLVASYYSEITMTIAMTPCDFVMEGYHRDGKDKAAERPGEGESIATWQGKILPYLPYAYRHPQYWEKLKEESKKSGNLAASREMFQLSEQLHPVREEEWIKVENIQGTVILSGAEDDCLWDTCRYIRRMKKRMKEHGFSGRCLSLLYKHGTHFLFPQTMLRNLLSIFGDGIILVFKAGRKHPVKCRRNRIDLEKRLKREILRWKEK